MFYRLLIFACLTIFVVPRLVVATQPPRPEQRQGLRDDASLRSVFFIDTDQGWAVGDRGVIWHTPDGGKHWLPQDSGVGCRLDTVQFVNPDEGWAAGGWYDPDTQVSRGVVLRTRDGGQTWDLIETDLPRIRSLRLVNRREGIAAGDWSPVHLGSVFLTYDGGSTWQRAPRFDAGPAIAMQYSSSVLTLGRSGAVRWAGHPESPSSLVLANSRFQAIGAGAREQCLVGRQGTIFSSFDAGRSWKSVKARDSHSIIDAYDLNCVAGAGNFFWMAGTPGNRIFFKEASGEIGHAPTGTSVPIHAMHFIDRHHGWAACSMGTILHTSDGGRSWQPQRGARRHAATLYVSRKPRGLPWSVIASESLEKGFRSVVAIERAKRVSQLNPLIPEAIDTTSQALSAAGGSDAMTFPPVDEPSHEATLVRILQTAKPSVVVLSDDLTRDQSSAWLRVATATPSVLRVFQSHPGERGDVVTHPAAILPAAGEVIADAWADALAIVAPGEKRAHAIASDRLLEREPTVRPLESLHHRLPIGAGGNARRMPPNGSRTQLSSLGPRTRHGEWAKQLIDATTVAPDPSELFQARLRLLIDQIQPSDRPRFLRRLILECRDMGDPALYRMAVAAAAKSVPDSPLGSLAELIRVSIEASEEWTRLPSKPLKNLQVVRDEGRPVPTAHGSPFASSLPVMQSSHDQKQGRTKIQDLTITDPLWRLHPLRLLAHQARFGDKSDSSVVAACERLSGATSAGPWQILAAGPAALRAGKPIAAAIHQASFTSVKPRLDGRFDDPLWQSGENNRREPSIRFAYDGAYVYIAINGGLPCDDNARESSERHRDADLDSSQRIALEIDVDRDMLTSYRLEIDAQGRCRDTCNGFPQWNPMWFVKTTTTNGRWTAEIAIRRDDLFGLPIVPGDLWHVRLQTLRGNQSKQPPLIDSGLEWKFLAFK